jgi:hypothetical protein
MSEPLLLHCEGALARLRLNRPELHNAFDAALIAELTSALERVAAGPLGAEPLLVQVGFTRFALRRAEAARVRLRSNGSGA